VTVVVDTGLVEAYFEHIASPSYLVGVTIDHPAGFLAAAFLA
jgi:hypothetical protein